MSTPETYSDSQLATIVVGLRKSMKQALLGDPWPHSASVKALQDRGLMLSPGWTLSPRGQAVADYIKRRRAAR